MACIDTTALLDLAVGSGHRSRERARSKVAALQAAGEAIVRTLQHTGTPIGDMDALIASVCLVAGHSILTRNIAHFSRVPGLIVATY